MHRFMLVDGTVVTLFLIVVRAANILCTRHVLLNKAPNAKENAMDKR